MSPLPLQIKASQRHDNWFLISYQSGIPLFHNPMKEIRLYSNILQFSSVRQLRPAFVEVTSKRRFASKMSTAKEFPPEKVRAIVSEVASLLKERKESVSVAETVRFCFSSRPSALIFAWVLHLFFICSEL